MRANEDLIYGTDPEGEIFSVDRGAVKIEGSSGPNFFHLTGGSIRIRNFDTSKDHLDFGVLMKLPITAHIVGANIVLSAEDSIRVTLLDAAWQFNDLGSALMNRMSASDRLASLRPYLGRMTRDEVADLVLDSLGRDGSSLFGNDPDLIFRSIQPRASWEVNNILHPLYDQGPGHPDLDTIGRDAS